MLRALFADRSVIDHPMVAAIQRRLGLPATPVEGPETVYRRVLASDGPFYDIRSLTEALG